MAAGDTLQGYRAASVQVLYDGDPGGYTPVSNSETGETVWWIKDPAGHVGRLGKHEVVEHDDGTITVSPSILSTQADHGHDWHGYLEHGVWREV